VAQGRPRPERDPFEALIEELPQILWAANPTDGVVYHNRFWSEYAGLPTERGLGFSWTEVIHPDDRSHALSSWRAAVEAGQPASWRVRMRRKDGVYRTFVCRVAPAADLGEAISWVGILTDVETQLELETAVNARHRGIVETATEGIWMIDADHKTTFVNHRLLEMLGYSREEMLGRHYADFVRTEERAMRIERGVRARVLRPQPVCVEIALRRKDGGLLWVESIATPLRDADGRHAGGLAIISDITERRRAEEKLRENSEKHQALSRRMLEVQEAERQRLASELSDQIGGVLRSLSEKLRAATDLVPPRAKKQLYDSIAIVDRAIAQTNSMSLELRPCELDDRGLEPALDRFLEQQRARTGLAIELSVHLSRRLPSELETACFRVVQEAITNAIRHARATGAWIVVSDESGRLEVSICDNGVGFDPEEARRRAERGASAGLVGMRERVLLLGGRLEIESTPSSGTRISIEIPLDARA
jgi:PAS domain S-box-containing protein